MAVKDPWVEYFMVGFCKCVVQSLLTEQQDTVIIDGGAEPERIIQWIDEFSGQGPDWTNGPQSFAEMKEMNLPSRKVVALLNTHAHFDHSGHIPDLKERYKVDWYLHPDDTFFADFGAKISTSIRFPYS